MLSKPALDDAPDGFVAATVWWELWQYPLDTFTTPRGYTTYIAAGIGNDKDSFQSCISSCTFYRPHTGVSKKKSFVTLLVVLQIGFLETAHIFYHKERVEKKYIYVYF